jgi:hypothetical protein
MMNTGGARTLLMIGEYLQPVARTTCAKPGMTNAKRRHVARLKRKFVVVFNILSAGEPAYCSFA